MHELILRRAEIAGDGVIITLRVDHSEQVPVLLKDEVALAWLSPAGAEHIARPGLAARGPGDPEIRLEAHLAALTSNTSTIVAEYFRCILAQLEEDHSPIQLTLPLAEVIASQRYSQEMRRLYSRQMHRVCSAAPSLINESKRMRGHAFADSS